MADWYCSSAAYSGYTAFAGSHAYSIGDIIVPTAPAVARKFVFRCTTAGTSTTEPSWASAGNNNSTIASGTATFTNITGQSSFFWTAAAGDLQTLLVFTTGRAGSDRFFISSDHAETQTATSTYGGLLANSFVVTQYLCVNRAGSTPPVAADLATGAVITVSSGNLILETQCESYHYGITYSLTSSNSVVISNLGFKSVYLASGQIWLNSSNAGVRLYSANSGKLYLDNTTLKFGSVSQTVGGSISNVPFEIVWVNTPSAIAGATIPTILFAPGAASLLVTCRGVDLSGTTNNLVEDPVANSVGGRFLFDSCKIASGVTRYNTTNTTNTNDLIELVNCYDGTNIISESYQSSGTLTTETTITLTSGAQDDVGAFSHKMVSNTNVDKFVNTMNSFWMDVENTATGSLKTATVEIISSASLNTDEISLFLQYEGTAGSSLASGASSFLLTPLTAAAAVTTSAATWNSSPATPQTQKLQASFTPQHAGRVRGQVRLGKASTTVYYNPQITIT